MDLENNYTHWGLFMMVNGTMICNMDMDEWCNQMVISIKKLLTISYQGQWRNDKAWGQGKYSTIDGTIYEGDWIEDK